jgi:hypothetical protein
MTNNDLITNSITSIRLIARSIDLDDKKDQDIFLSFKNLSKFVFQNFDIPSTHYDYIENSFKNRNVIFNGSTQNFIDLFGNKYSIEIPLRAIEVVFSYAEEDKEYDIHKLIKLKYLISKLHHYVGRKYFEQVDENTLSLNY